MQLKMYPYIIGALISISTPILAETKGKVSFWNKTGARKHFFVDWRSDSFFGSCKDQSEYVDNNVYISKTIGSGYCILYRMRVHGQGIPIGTNLLTMHLFRPKKYNNESPETCYIVTNNTGLRSDQIDCSLMYNKETDPEKIEASINAFKGK